MKEIWFAITTWAYGESDEPGIEHENKPIALILEYITYVLQEPVEESNLLVNRSKQVSFFENLLRTVVTR